MQRRWRGAGPYQALELQLTRALCAAVGRGGDWGLVRVEDEVQPRRWHVLLALEEVDQLCARELRSVEGHVQKLLQPEHACLDHLAGGGERWRV